MENKKQQNDQGTTAARIFEVHTMKKDALNPPTSKKTDIAIPKEEQPAFAKNTQSKQKQEEINPFLDTQDPLVQKEKITFMSGPKAAPIEKINQSPSDIAKNAALPLKNPMPVKQSKNTLHIVMIVFVVVFLIGAIAFGGYMLMGQRTADVTDNTLQEQPSIVDDTQQVAIKDTEIYSKDLPNYFSFDVESQTTKDDIAAELNTIKNNLQQSDIQEPISFIVTDQKENPVSFHVFAISAGLSIPQEVMASLEENFEIYAYNDATNGVRFGFAIDIKNVKLLQDNLKIKENDIPKGIALILDGMDTAPTAVVFKDSVYNTYAIRYANLDAAETYSVDYTISDQRFVLGTSKSTLRAMLDDIKRGTIAPDAPAGFTY